MDDAIKYINILQKSRDHKKKNLRRKTKMACFAPQFSLLELLWRVKGYGTNMQFLWKWIQIGNQYTNIYLECTFICQFEYNFLQIASLHVSGLHKSSSVSVFHPNTFQHESNRNQKAKEPFETENIALFKDVECRMIEWSYTPTYKRTLVK